MKGKSNCKKCKNNFEWSRTFKQIQNLGNPKYCSQSCRAKDQQKDSVFSWDKLDEEKKLERLKFFFNKKVEKKDGCWGWKSTIQSGYGALNYDAKIIGAHRASWILHYGKIPKDICVCHKCDNKLCTNPEHLFLGTYKENSQDRENKGRGIRGNRVPRSALNEEKVLEIRKMLENHIPSTVIARKYGVHHQTIYNIKWKKFWKWIKNA